ncbi:hypothetical protein [Mycolicibacterium sp. S3B2]|uniref:hypothetical protein n=1 Tax=Mycolicibacterium sp. S3B2 TaxID=3415120 RepID=UPI003C7BC4A1
MDGHAGRDPGTDPPELTAAVLADLQAGLLDDATAARIRRRARDDPEATRTLAHLDAVRGELARLGSDPSGAPDPPPDVTARVGAAVRAASSTPEHRIARPSLSRPQRVAVGGGLLAATAAVAIGAVTLTREPGPSFPAGPTASQITAAPDDFPVPETELRALLSAPADLGPLTDPRRLASCLAGLGHSPGGPVLGARTDRVAGRPAVVLVLPAEVPDRATAVVVASTCSAADSGLLARRSLDLP